MARGAARRANVRQPGGGGTLSKQAQAIPLCCAPRHAGRALRTCADAAAAKATTAARSNLARASAIARGIQAPLARFPRPGGGGGSSEEERSSLARPVSAERNCSGARRTELATGNSS